MSSRHLITNKAGKFQAVDSMPVCLHQNHSITRLNQHAQDGRMNGIDLSSNQQLPTNNLQVKSVNSTALIRLVVDSLIRLVVKPTTYNLQPSTSNQQLLSPLSSLLVFLLLIISNVGRGQQSILNTSPVSQNFDGMGTSGTAALPSGFRVNTTANWNTGLSVTIFAYGTTGTGAVMGTSTGGAINWANGITGTATDRALGFLTSSAYTSPRSIIYAFTNNTGSTVTSISISFDYEKYRSGTRAFDWTFFHGATATNVNIAATDGNQSYAADANNTTIFNPPTSNAKTVTLTGLSIVNGATYYLAWIFTGIGGSTNGQGIGIDNFSITLNPVLTPTLTAPTTLTGFTYSLGAGPSAVQSFNLTGSNLTGFPGNITVNAPANFLVSNAPGGPFGSSALISFSSASLNAPVYVQLAAGLTQGTYSGDIIFSGGGVTTPPTVALSGTVTSVAESNIIAVANSETATISSLTTGAVTNISSGVQVWAITIQDGGNDLTDSDALPTTVNSITLRQNIGNAVNDWADAIEEIAIFDGATKLASGVVVTATTITFSGSPLISVADNSSKTLTIRLTLQQNHNNSGSNIEGDDFVFQISRTDVTANPSGSLFTTNATDFPSINSVNDLNAISIIATELRFTAPPFTTDVNAVMSPSPVVSSTDIFGNIDRNMTGSATITSTGNLSGLSGTNVSFTLGAASFGNLIHTAVGLGFTLTATSGSLTSSPSTTFDITNPGGTSFEKGDLLILAFLYDRDNGLNGIEDDEITFFALKDITNGTIFYFTDNGFERNYAGLWGTTEGFLKIQKTSGPTIPAGKILTIGINTTAGGAGGNASHFKIIDQCGTDITSLFTLTLQGLTFNMNVQDDLWISQGGSFTNISTTGPDVHKASYNGTILTGWSGTGYQSCIGSGTDFNACSSPGVTGSQGTRIFPKTSCFVIDLSTSTIPVPPSNDRGRVKYTGPLTISDKKGWIDRLSNVSNWTGYASDALYDGGPKYVNSAGNCDPLPLDLTPVTPGVWNGMKSTDWFDCANWNNREVPDAATEVMISSGANNSLVDDASVFAPLYSNIAVAKSVTINNSMQLSLGSTVTDILTIGGNMTLNGSSRFNNGNGVLNLNNNGSLTFNATSGMNGGTGTTNIQGNFTAASTAVITPESGIFNFTGSLTQTITNGHVNPVFNNLTINNSSALGVTLAGSAQLQMNGLLTLQDGLVNTSLTNLLTLTSNATCPSGGSDDSFVNGPMRKIGNTNFTFPVGKPVTGTNPVTGGYRSLAISNPDIANVTDVFTCEFYLGPARSLGVTLTDPIKRISACEYWRLDRTGSNSSVFVTLSWNEKSKCSSADYVTNPSSLVVAKGDGYTNCTWTSFGGNANGTNNAGTVTSTQAVNQFSPFALGTTSFTENPLPIKLLYFRAVAKGEQVALSWQVADNHEALSYVLERSRNGVQFEHLKTVAPIPNEELASYKSYDEQPWQGINYYRLRITDIFGKVIYSSIQKVNIEHAQAVSLRISPNPAKDRLLILLSQPEKINELNIVNSVGQTLFKQSKLQSTNPVDISSLRPGIYYVRIIGQAGMQMESFVKE
ncbi:MAG: T9SS type A sorting domain-containing protein [Bacteroidetes bacterium]|nr:T9SS type A sorting domain-containing protein [Bacteroidota bacterium]